jgi:hypothetical protein
VHAIAFNVAEAHPILGFPEYPSPRHEPNAGQSGPALLTTKVPFLLRVPLVSSGGTDSEARLCDFPLLVAAVA